MLTGETLSAEQALETRLIDEMTDEASLVDKAIDMAAAMGSNPQRADDGQAAHHRQHGGGRSLVGAGAGNGGAQPMLRECGAP